VNAMHVVIVANAPAVDVAPYRSLIQAADRLIAADGGGTALFREGYAPSLLIGDAISIRLYLKRWLRIRHKGL